MSFCGFPMVSVRQYITQHFFRSPTRVAITLFTLLVFAGTLLLRLPLATTSGQISFIDALFTTVSAVSVTGLGVVDTGTYFTAFGQVVIMLLVQLGGVGIMTFSTLFILMAGRKPGIVAGQTIQDTYTQTGDRSPLDILKAVLVLTFAIEAVGVAILACCFLREMAWPQALYTGLFHSICAFCNAGFSLFPDNLMRYRADWWVSLTVAVLIILGGTGFLVMTDIHRAAKFRGKAWRRLSLQTKLVLSITGILLVSSTLIIMWMERGHTLHNLPLNQKILASFFEAVTARTAGFNTIDHAAMANETLFFVIILMFIGAAPGSCAGGVKITSVSILVLLGIAHFKGEDRPQIFYRSINKSFVDKAISTVFLSMIAVFAVTMCVEMAEEFNAFLPRGHDKFLDILFEVVSAFGTVGLSTGFTSKFTSLGKFFLVIMMVVGKLGMMTLIFAMSQRRIKKYFYAEENVMIS